MAAISQKLANLVGGVSQQPDTVKFSNQLRSCDNYYPDFTLGLAKRPGLQAKGKLANAVDDGTWFHIFRDNKEKYIFQFSKAGALKVWDANSGIQQTVNTVAAEATTYATHTSFDNLATLQINDYIFILNRTVTVKPNSSSSSSYNPFGFVNINTVAFNTDYIITIDGNAFSHTTPSNASGSTQNSVQTIITALVNSINGNAAYVASGIGNTIFIRRANDGDFSLKATGGTIGTAVEAFKEIVTSVSQLPREFFSDRRIKIEGSADSEVDNYWVKFVPSTAGQTSGVGNWEETIAPNTVLGMDTTTLPHVVIREANGTFTYRQLDEASAIASQGTAGGAATVSRTASSTTATVTTTSAHNLTTGDKINVTEGVASGDYTITVLTSTTFTITTVATTALSAVTFVYTSSTTVVTGIPESISITSATSGGHVVKEEFAVTGGTGKNLRLRVDKVKTATIADSYAATSSSYVRQVTTTTTRPYYFSDITETSTSYLWYLSGKQIGKTTDTDLVVGDVTYVVNGSFQRISNETRAGISSVKVTNGIIDAVSIIQAGQNYTALNSVSNASGDTFRIETVNTKNLEGDEVRLQYWKPREIGDSKTNPMPSFVNNTIDGISFFKNRIIFTSRQNVICSQAGDYFNFFASTVITIIDSDPIDLSASSSKPIKFQHLLPIPRAGLLLFGDNAQYILETTTEAFAPKTAEINRLSSFSLTDSISPIDVGPSYMFLEQGDKATAVYEMNIGDNVGGKPIVQELTKPLPYYIPAAIKNLKVSQSANTFAILSEQDLKSIYFYKFFNAGDTRVSAWFRWVLPGTVESFDFDQDIMYVVSKQGSDYILNTVSLLTETPSQSLLFDGEYLDVRLDYFDYNPVLVYNSTSDTTRVCFKDGFNNSEEQPVLMYLNPAIAGYFEEQTLQYDSTASTGQKYYLEAEGNETAAGGKSTVSRTSGSTTATITCTSPHGLTTGDKITVISGVVTGDYTVTVLTTTTFTITTVATTVLSSVDFIFSCSVTASKFAIGYKYEAIAELPAFYFVKGEGNKDTLNIPRINRLKINSYNSGPYRALVTSEGRNDFSLSLPQINANYYKADNIPIIRNAESTVPILAKGNQFSFSLIADSPFPTAFTSLTWEGTYNNKGIQSL
jgi:hypothetical protein